MTKVVWAILVSSLIHGPHGWHVGDDREGHCAGWPLPTGYSSVGRASDCRDMQQSDGPWFDSGWPDILFLVARRDSRSHTRACVLNLGLQRQQTLGAQAGLVQPALPAPCRPASRTPKRQGGRGQGETRWERRFGPGQWAQLFERRCFENLRRASGLPCVSHAPCFFFAFAISTILSVHVNGLWMGRGDSKIGSLGRLPKRQFCLSAPPPVNLCPSGSQAAFRAVCGSCFPSRANGSETL